MRREEDEGKRIEGCANRGTETRSFSASEVEEE